jgi:hypothetical protein
MADNPFDSAWLKWAQAVVNAEVLEDNINELAGQGVLQMRFGMTKEYDAKRHCIIVTAGPEGVSTVFPITWGLLLGDIVHNYRSSLDHLAWALYKRGSTANLPKRKERLIYFPIADERIKFNDSLGASCPVCGEQTKQLSGDTSPTKQPSGTATDTFLEFLRNFLTLTSTG